LGPDGPAYVKLMGPLLLQWDGLISDLLGDMRSSAHPLTLLKFALKAMPSARDMVESRFHGQHAAGLFAGLCAHSIIPLEDVPSAAIGLVLCTAGHRPGWPVPAGGSGSISRALASYFLSLGGKIETRHRVTSLADAASAGDVFFDTSPGQMASICSGALPERYLKSLRKYSYGPGIFKMDWALSGPIPWRAQECKSAGTVHLGGTFEEIARAERSCWEGNLTSRPFVLLSQPSLFDTSRAPAGFHTAWAYCHVPNGCNFDMAAYVENQVERFAPGFRELVMARHPSTPSSLEAGNANLVGGDITGGAQKLTQLFCRPTCSFNPYRTPRENIWLCSASTPPGAGVHGMCGYHAAVAYLRRRKTRA
jgi:phytoene dehydrogenase-like protein